jgi:hypothetical protein
MVPLVLAALGLAASLLLFLSTKREMRAQERRYNRRIEEMMDRLREASQVSPPAPVPPEPIYVPVALRSGLNTSRRVQALRLLRRGETAAHVSAALGVPRQEIELLMRVQGISVKRTDESSKGQAAGA